MFADSITGDGAGNRLFGRAQSDTLSGEGGRDRLLGGSANDSLSGGNADDRVQGGRGADTMDGGAGFDKLEYNGAAAGIAVDLLAGTGGGGDAAGDVVSGFEHVAGALFDDTITGDGEANLLVGRDGADALSGGAGDDTILGGDDADTIAGGAGNDVFNGDGGLDRFVFADGFGRDRLIDFDADDGEKIDLSGVTAITDFNDLVANHLRTHADTGWAEIFDGANRILLTGYTVAQVGAGQPIDAGDFAF